MRLRFFGIILSVLLLSSAAVVYIHIYFFRDEPMDEINKQITSNAAKLIQTPMVHWPEEGFSNRTEIGKILSKTLGDNRIDQIFMIRQGDKVLFRTYEIPLLKENFPTEPGWHSTEIGSHFVQMYNVAVPGEPGRIVQVAAILDVSLLDWKVVDIRVVTFLGLTLVLCFVVATFLTFLLLAPMRAMNSHLHDATADLKNLKDVSPLPAKLLRIGQNPWPQNDDFGQLVKSVQRLIERINANYRLTRSWTFQMAHELKTPLTLMRAEVEVALRKKEISREFATSLIGEVDYISDVITQFLDWADIENSSAGRQLHAVRLSTIVKNLKNKFDKVYPNRLQVRGEHDPLVLSNPMHLEQVVNNLVTNSLKYSPNDTSVDLLIEENAFRVVDRGAGIPRDVMDRLGEPFNFGPDSRQRDLKSNGLGLAWVNSVSKIYNWDIHVSSSNRGTDISIQFPVER